MTNDEGFVGRTWRLVELDGSPIAAEGAAEIMFGDDGRAVGTTGVNRLRLGFRHDEDGIEFTPAATTRMAGPPAAMGQEQAVLANLTGRQPYTLDGDDLTIGTARFRSVEPSEADTVVVSGSVLYRERIALPDGAVVTVRVEDVSRADAPSVTIAEQRIEPDRQVPIPFSIPVARHALEPTGSYGVAARIEVGGELAWISDTHHPVATDGPTTTDIVVVNARRS